MFGKSSLRIIGAALAFAVAATSWALLPVGAFAVPAPEPVTIAPLFKVDVIIGADMWDTVPRIMSLTLNFTDIIGVPGADSKDEATAKAAVVAAGGAWSDIGAKACSSKPTQISHTTAVSPEQYYGVTGILGVHNTDVVQVQTGWIPSVNTPHTPGSFAHALSVVQNAERLGFDFVLSPQNWRGAEGPSRYWRDTVESLMATSALLQATTRIEVWGTAHVLVYPPALIAKMMASLSEIGQGRVGLNVVTGGHYMSFGPLGFWDDTLDHDQLYDVAQEWLGVIKQLWTEPSVDHEGERFKLFDARLDPKPSTLPRIVNAGASPRGMRFAVENCDVAFMLAGADNPSFRESAMRAHELAKELDKPDFKIYGLVTLITGETDLEAQALMDRLEEGVDLEALADMEEGYRKNVKGFKDLSSSSLAVLGGAEYRSVMPGTLVGSYDTMARLLAETVKNYGLGGLMIIVADYTEHLPKLAERTFPKLAEYGIECNVRSAS